MKKILILVMVVFLCGSNSAEIKNAGVIGNSGERGNDLVRFGGKSARGMGVAYDRFGRLWDRAGEGVLNCYALDGRMIAQYSIPGGQDNNDKLTLVGDILVLRIRKKIYILDINEPSGASAKALNLQAAYISFGNLNGNIAFIDKDRNVALLNPKTEEVSIVTKLPIENCRDIELSSDGTIYLGTGGKIYKIENSKFVEDWECSMRGERIQLLGDMWLSHGWHGTMYRFDKDMQPSPGVILGGASGSFIGHLAQNSELINGRGVAKIRENLYAVSGFGGVLHLLEWDSQTKRMTIVRRIGALENISGIGLDMKGRIWAVTGIWEWLDKPDTPIRLSVNPPEAPGTGQIVMLENDHMVAAGFMWGMPSFFYGPLDTEIKSRRIKQLDLRRGAVGAAVYKQDNKLTLLSIDAAGKGQAFYIGSNGQFRGNAGDVTLNTNMPTTNWTSLAMTDNSLLAGADGYIIKFEQDGSNWQEVTRWNSWGNKPDEKFGDKIFITYDSGQLWVSDTSRHRVLCIDPIDKKLLDVFGDIDSPGTGMKSLHSPKSIVARGKTRAVVFDSGNQRLIKLEK